MGTTLSKETSGVIKQVCEQFFSVLKRQAEQLERLGQDLQKLQNEQLQLEEVAAHLVDPLEKALAEGLETKGQLPSSLLSSVCRLASATYAEQVFSFLAQEATRMDVRSAVFDVRGRAAWGTAACGFEPELSGEALRALVVPLNHDGPFRQAFEMAEAVETSVESLARNRNLVAKLNPALNSRILLAPVRSAWSVAAVFYAEAGDKHNPALIDAMKILVEFAGAQIDRLMAISGGLTGTEPDAEQQKPSTAMELTPTHDSETEAVKLEVRSVPESHGVMAAELPPVESPGSPSDEKGLPLASPRATDPAVEAQTPPNVGLDVANLSEEERKIHLDAQRFSKLLVSEIELYNKSGVEEGRKNRDLYLRLKKDIDRSRETYEKRFANTIASQVDYFHEELVRQLAGNDPSLLGSGYPGPSV